MEQQLSMGAYLELRSKFVDYASVFIEMPCILPNCTGFFLECIPALEVGHTRGAIPPVLSSNKFL
jgi:hypothetical protein